MQELPTHLKKLIEDIHATPQLIVYDFAGAGTQALAWLHGVGGSSRTILEATDRYAATSLVEAIGFEPRQFTSPEVARAMATNAYIRACNLADTGTLVAGIGCTATIATNRQKRGEHRCFIAVCNAQGITTYTLKLTKGLRSRQEEEHLVSLLVLRTIAKLCGLAEQPILPLQETGIMEEEFEQVGLLKRLVAGEIGLVTVGPDGRMVPGKRLSHVAMLSGAFNPLHEGHRKLARIASKILGQEIYFELPMINADKAPIDSAETQRRVAQFADFGPLILTGAPLFSQKIKLFPHSTFIIGVDTAKRIIQTRFYDNDPTQMLAALDEIRVAGCRFLVAGRLIGDHFLTLRDLSLPPGYRELFEEIPEVDFRVDVSSTTLRNR